MVQQHSSAGPSVLAGLVGAGIAASRTPRLHEREGAEHGLRYIYRLIDLDQLGLDSGALPDILTAAQRFGFSGLNVTHPCKQTVIPFLDELSPEAAALGAVNTVVLTAGRSVGHNTDRSGFETSFRREFSDVARRCVVQVGAGGAGAAVTHALLSLGVDKLCIVDTRQERARQLARAAADRFGQSRVVANPDLAEAMSAADGVVNATPQGMTGHPGCAVPATALRAQHWVADIVYVPLETELLRQARALGCRTMGGGGMAVFQAADAFHLFTGIEPDRERMLAHFHSM